MKKCILSAVFIWFVALSLFAQTKVGEVKGFFTIQIKSLSKPVELSYFEALSGVWEKKGDDGMYKYFYGRFPDYASAREVALKLKKDKYTDAFVVFSDKSILPANKLKLNGNSKPVVKGTVSQPLSAEKKQTKVEKEKTSDKWTIQLAAFKYPRYIDDFKPLTDVMEFFCADKKYRYSVGVFDTYEAAKAQVAKYKSMGYSGAFVVGYDKLEPFMIE